MTMCAGSQVLACFTERVACADGVRAMPSARALLVASLLTEPPFGCLGPSGNDRYRKRPEAVGASRERVGLEVGPRESAAGKPRRQEGSSNRALRNRCTGIAPWWPNPEPGATT